MNFTCSNGKRRYVPPSSQSSTYIGGRLVINNIPVQSVSSSVYLNHKVGECSVIANHKNSSYERVLHKKKWG